MARSNNIVQIFNGTNNNTATRKLPQRANTYKYFKDKHVSYSKELDHRETKRDQIVNEEVEAIALTEGVDHPRPNRRLTDFVLHDVNGKPQLVEMLEETDIFISGRILPLEKSSDKHKERGIKCLTFGRVETWAISGYEDGSPVVWLSTELADYDCVKPAHSYKKLYGLFYEKAHACIEIYKKLSESIGGDPNMSYGNLLTQVVHSMRKSKNFPQGLSVRKFILSHGEFIYKQITSLDESSKESDQLFCGLPSLTSLRDESINTGIVAPYESALKRTKLACVLHKQESWNYTRQKKRKRTTIPLKKYYIKINEDDIGNDYPLPEYYKSKDQDMDELKLKTERLAISIISMLKEQPRVSRLCFSKVIKKVAEFKKDHQAYISSNPETVERYVVVHGQIILQQFAEFPDKVIQRSSFVKVLNETMEQRHHNKWLLKTKAVLYREERNLNPSAQMLVPAVLKREVMPATITKLIYRIWKTFYDNYLPEDSLRIHLSDVKEDEVDEMQLDEEDDDSQESKEEIEFLTVGDGENPDQLASHFSNGEIIWEGEAVDTNDGKFIYKKAIVRASVVSIGCSVLVETTKSEGPSFCLIEYFFENSDARKMAHGRLMVKGIQTVLGNAANEREVFLTNKCLIFDLSDIVQEVVVEIRSMTWGYQHRKENFLWDKIDRNRAEDRKNKGLSIQYFCKSMYCPDEGGFFSFQKDTIGLGTGMCHSCEKNRILRENELFKMNSSFTGFKYLGVEYNLNDFVYLRPYYFQSDKEKCETFKCGRNVGLKAFVIGQILEIKDRKTTKTVDSESLMVKFRRFFRPEDVSTEKAYGSDIREVYYSEEIVSLPITALEGKCKVRKKQDVSHVQSLGIFDHIFYCDYFYDPKSGVINELPAHIKQSYSKTIDQSENRNKGKCKEGKVNFDTEKQRKEHPISPLSTLDIFAGCGGLSEGLRESGVCETKWAIEYDKLAGEAFRFNHPESVVHINNCNVILRAIMDACGDSDDCISTFEATELAKELDKELMDKLPFPGQVDFISGGPPCQGFCGMNRFNQSPWSKIQCEMILAFLSYADYFRPKYFLLENVRNFVSFNKGQTFRLTIASLIEMGYQVRFGILEAGAYGISQSRKRAFIWAASPEEKLPDWPEPIHVFATPKLKVNLNRGAHYVAVRSTSSGAPLRPITVRDTIGDLPAVKNGASVTTMDYGVDPISWFQKKIRENMSVLTDHISKAMNELNLIRCKRIPFRPGADWRDLPDEKVHLSKGKTVDLIPRFLPNSAKRNNQWKGLFGRLNWEGNFPTSVTDPQPTRKVGMCFHPNQDRIVTVRECARSQGFVDSYKFVGNIQHKHRQIGNAVPPPLAFALGTKLKEAIEGNGILDWEGNFPTSITDP